MTQTLIRKRRDYAVTGQVGQHLSRAQALQAEIARLTADLSIEREWLLDHMVSKNLDNMVVGEFQAIRKVRHKWEYSESTEREMLALRNLQKWEQQQGTAIDTPTTYLQLCSKS